MVDLTVRKDYSKLHCPLEMPNLLEVQIKSFEDFLQKDVPPHERRKRGLEAVFQEMFPIEDSHRNFSLEYLGYTLGENRYCS